MTEKIRNEIPGTNPVVWREYCYVSDDGRERFFKNGLFKKLTCEITPFIPKSGGAMTENCKLWLPSGELFHALSYKGDIDGWREQISNGANQLGLLTAKIVNNQFILSDGRSYHLSDCKAEFY